MKKKFMLFASLVVLALGFSSCGAVSDGPGFIYTGQTRSYAVTDNTIGSKVGTVKTINVFSMVAVGDASVNKAAKMAGIKKVSHVDVKTTSILTLFCIRTYYVYGE